MSNLVLFNSNGSSLMSFSDNGSPSRFSQVIPADNRGQEVITTTGLLLNWDIGNPASYPGTGTSVTDLSGNGYNGLLVNGPTYTGSNGGALILDGVDDFISASYNSGYALLNRSTYSFEFWVRPETNGTTTFPMIGGREGFFSVPGNSRDGQNVYYTQTAGGSNVDLAAERRVAGTWPGGPSWRTTTTSFFLNWQHIVVTYDGTSVRLYVNNSGPLGGVGTSTGNITNVTTPFSVGDNDLSNTTPMKGQFAIARIYNIALDTTQIATNYNNLKGRFGIA